MLFSRLFSRGLSANINTIGTNHQELTAQGNATWRSSWQLALAGAAAVALGSGISASAQTTTCTGGATLIGAYGLYAIGQDAAGSLNGITGSVVFDGACGLTADVVTNAHGSVVSAYAQTTGSYTTNADGTIAISLLMPVTGKTATYVVNYSPVFHEALGNETDGSASATIDLKAMGSSASLKGTFAASGQSSDQLTVTFDGAGNLTVTDRSQYVLQGAVATGTYFVNLDGTIGGYLSLGGATYAFGGVADNSSNEFQLVLNSGPGSQYVPLEGFIGKRIK